MHCYKCDDCAAYNYGDVALPRVLEVLERFGVVADGKVVGLDEARREKTLTELNLIANRDFEFSTVGLLHPLTRSETPTGRSWSRTAGRAPADWTTWATRVI